MGFSDGTFDTLGDLRYPSGLSKYRTDAKALLNTFNSWYAPTEKWWYQFSIRQMALKHSRLSNWVSIAQDFRTVEEFYVIQDAMRKFAPSHEYEMERYLDKRDKNKKAWDIRNLENRLEIAKVMLDSKIKNPQRIAFNLLISDSLENETYDRVLLYVTIGCTPDTIVDFKDLPTSFLVKTASLLGE